jgi:hypothetical protein
MYLTLGNIPKHIRQKPSHHAQVLLAYLPITKLEKFTNQASWQHAVNNLFHACLCFIVQPLETLGCMGIKLTSSDGKV